MAILILPAAGLSTRYGVGKPKFLLQSPNCRPMIAEALSGFINFEKSGLTSICVISLKEYFEDISTDYFISEIQRVLPLPVELILLDHPTQSMVHTISKFLITLKSDEEIIIKDCDNLVQLDLAKFAGVKNAISYVNLKNYSNIVAHNKSFLRISSAGVLDDIIEKEIISSFINIGCIKFASASSFLSTINSLHSNSELFVSDVVRAMVSVGEGFQTLEAEHYEDWGTLSEWKHYCQKFATYFIDIDGVVSFNTDPLKLNMNWGSFRSLENNCKYLVSQQGKVKMVFTTSRSEDKRNFLEEQLKSLGFENFDLIMGLPHAKRILINDFAPTNPYPSAIAINFPRNLDNLHDYI